jgi:Ser/Thr protein kinase RdoA (MazF antagonist)
MDSALAAALFTPAAREALRAFPIEAGEIELVSVSENVTFRVIDQRDGAAYVLRLHRPGYHTHAALDSERVWTRALAEAGVDVPVPVTANDGRDYVLVHVREMDQHRQAGMTHWNPGEILEDVLARADGAAPYERWFERLGALSAAMHNQSSAWRPPQSFQRHALDADGLLGEAPFWGRFWEHQGLSPGERRQLLETREQVRGALDRYGRSPETYGVIHADLHMNNLLVDGDRLTVIDFDDTAFGWYLYDIAVALKPGEGRPDFAVIEDAFFSGYRTARPISEAARALVPMFRLVRGMVVIGWLHQRPEINPGKDFDAMKDRVCTQCAAFEVPC